MFLFSYRKLRFTFRNNGVSVPCRGFCFYSPKEQTNKAKREDKFPSPVGDFVFISEKKYALINEKEKSSVPCRGFCFYFCVKIQTIQFLEQVPSPVGDFVFISMEKYNYYENIYGSVPCRGFCFYFFFSCSAFGKAFNRSVPCRGFCFYFPTCCILVFAMAAYMISGLNTIFFI